MIPATIDTENYRLIPLGEDHAEDLFSIYGDQDTMKHMQRRPLAGVNEAMELLRRWREEFKNHHGYRWGIAQPESTERIIGTIALHYWSKEDRNIELGADLHRDFWGRGIITEVTEVVMDLGFRQLDIFRMELRCDPRNKASTAVAAKMGFQFEGVLRSAVYIEDKGFMDEAVYSLLRPEWEKRHS